MIISSNGSLVVNISSASVDDRKGERQIEDFARYRDDDDGNYDRNYDGKEKEKFNP